MIAAVTSASVMFSWLIVSPMTVVSANVWMRLISLGRRRHRHVGEVAELVRGGRVLEDHAVGRLPRRMNVEVRYAGWLSAPWPSTMMTSGSFALERLDDGGFHLAGAELGRDGVERDAVAGALDQAGLAGADHDGRDAAVVERPGEDRGGGALADGAVGAEHRDPRAGDRRRCGR